ncbi:hypothetical protein [Kistimonas asteriae]|uniref:hypothetical protein n=1 Tax=Kistimonas asteriae TaxID=517724 RepID=UPI001BAA812B|nr:hypothetical protein [Kistimonas asteriae]
MSGLNKAGAGTVIACPGDNQAGVSFESAGREQKGRLNSQNVVDVLGESILASHSQPLSELQADMEFRSLEHRIMTLKQQPGLEESIKKSAQKAYATCPRPESLSQEVISGSSNNDKRDPILVLQFDKVLNQLAEERSLPVNSVVDRIVVDGDRNQKAGDGADAVIDSFEMDSSKKVAVKQYSRLWILFQHLKRKVRTLVARHQGEVKAKDFKVISPSLMVLFAPGTELQRLASEYNLLQQELETSRWDSVVEESRRTELKHGLLELVDRMQEEIKKFIEDVTYPLSDACDELSAKERYMLAEKLKSKFHVKAAGLVEAGPNTSALADLLEEGSLEEVSDVESDYMDMTVKTPFISGAMSGHYDVPTSNRPVHSGSDESVYVEMMSPHIVAVENDRGHYDVPPSNRPVDDPIYEEIVPRDASPDRHEPIYDVPRHRYTVATQDCEREPVVEDETAVDGHEEWPAPPPALTKAYIESEEAKATDDDLPPLPEVDDAGFAANHRDDFPPPPSVEQGAVSEAPRKAKPGYPTIAPKPPRKGS